MLAHTISCYRPAKSTATFLRTFTMASFTLYGGRGSSNTDRVRLTLAEGGITDYELVLLDLRKGEQKFPANMKRHPWGKIPSITTSEGLSLYESRAICKYLSRKHGIPVLPADSDLNAVALYEQAESVEILYFAGPAGKIGFEKFAKKFMGLPADETVVEGALKDLNDYFDIAERLLEEQEYMAGQNFTLVDIHYIPLVERLFGCGYGDLITSRKSVNAWWDRITSRPAIKQMLAADREAMVAATASRK